MTSDAAWRSSNSHVATVVAGLIPGRNPGGAEVRMAYEELDVRFAFRVERDPEPAGDHPPIRAFPNCVEMRDAGWHNGVNRNGGTYKPACDAAEIETYGLNTARDRDNDGHACERS